MDYQPSLEVEKFLVKLEKSHKNHNFEIIPDIIDHLTYIDETKNKKTGESTYSRKRLSPIAKELYRIIQKAAGSSICWKNTKTLAYEVNCSTGAVSKAKKELIQSFEQLEGKSLINITEKRVPVFNDSGKHEYSKPKHEITMTNIMPYNNALMRYQSLIAKPFIGQLTKEEAELAIEKVRQSYEQRDVDNPGGYSYYETPRGGDSHNERASQRGSSQCERKHTPSKHTPHVLKTYPLASPNQNALLNNDLEQCIQDDHQAFNFLLNFGIQEGMAKKIMKSNNFNDIILSVSYLKDQKVTSTYEGYLVKIILQKLWQRYD